MSDRIHELKVWPEMWDTLESERKTFEVRANDRGFAVGDLLHLREWDPARYSASDGNTSDWRHRHAFTGRELWRRVVFVLYGGRFGLPESLCVMGLEKGLNPRGEG